MIQFAQPIFLWALAGLAVPIGIHLLSRKEGQVVKMGSLRHLRETSTKQFKGIKLNELLLLALRCLLIILFVSLLAGFHWKDKSEKRWVLVEHGLENQQLVKTITDSLVSDGYELRWLQTGFPAQEVASSYELNYWRLLSELKKENLENAIVFSRSKMKNFNGFRTAMPQEVTWISIPTEPSQFILQAVKKENQFLVRQGHASSEKIHFETQQVSSLPDSIAATSMRRITISIVHDDAHLQDLQIIRAALNAIQETIPVEFSLNEISPAQSIASADWIVWLADSDVPGFDSTKSVVLKTQSSNELISKENSNQWTINKRLTIDVARKENLTLQLASLLLADPALKSMVEEYDNRMLPDSVIVSGKGDASTLKAGLLPQSPNRYLIFFFLIVLLTERIIAYARKQ
jgi:hypothetical protein